MGTQTCTTLLIGGAKAPVVTDSKLLLFIQVALLNKQGETFFEREINAPQ